MNKALTAHLPVDNDYQYQQKETYMTRAQGPSRATLQLMQAERRYDKVTILPQQWTTKLAPKSPLKHSADILPFIGFRHR